MKTFEVWHAYLPTDMGQTIPSPAFLVGRAEAETFQDACKKLCGDSEYFQIAENGDVFDWGQLFPTEWEANDGFAEAYKRYCI